MHTYQTVFTSLAACHMSVRLAAPSFVWCRDRGEEREGEERRGKERREKGKRGEGREGEERRERERGEKGKR